MRVPVNLPAAELVPHAGRMCLLDEVLEADDDSLLAVAAIRDDNLFAADGAAGGWVGIEYMAQAVAAWAGWQARQAGRGPRIGFLLGSRRYESRWPVLPVGTQLRIEVRRELQGDSGIGAFTCRIEAGAETIATATLTVFEPPDALHFLQQGTSS